MTSCVVIHTSFLAGVATGDIIGGELYEGSRLSAETGLVRPGRRAVHRVGGADPQVRGQVALGGGLTGRLATRTAAGPRAGHHHCDVTEERPLIGRRVQVRRGVVHQLLKQQKTPISAPAKLTVCAPANSRSVGRSSVIVPWHSL